MYDYLTVVSDAAEKHSFRRDELWRAWANQYPYLFDESDVTRAAVSACDGRHYREWLAAISIHKLTGYHCVLAKYQFKRRHPNKFERFVQLVPPHVRDLLPTTGRPQGPDLLMYAPSMEHWFFAEAKRMGECLTRSQRSLFPRIEQAWGQQIRVVRIED